MESVNIDFRLARATEAFSPSASPSRDLASPQSNIPFAKELLLDRWRESSLGDRMHKLVLVLSGQIDLEGGSGGWLVLANHMVFIPANRAFTLRSAAKTVVRVAHLDPEDIAWRHNGCWVTAAPALSNEMLAHAIGWSSEQASNIEGARLFFQTLSHLCREWFANPRMLWMPSAKSEEMRQAIAYVRENFNDATLDGACKATGLSARTLQRRCELDLGFSWRSLLREVKMMHAMELLASGAHPVSHVAQVVGFKSLAAFTTSFSQRVGMSPSEFTRSSRQNRGGQLPLAEGVSIS